jgi:hypothetical protein
MPTVNVLTQFSGADARPPILLTGNTGHATPGNRSNHAHGLSYTPVCAVPIPTASAADAALTADITDVAVVGITATNIIVRCGVTLAPFDLLIF